jgi:hypothetical protein
MRKTTNGDITMNEWKKLKQDNSEDRIDRLEKTQSILIHKIMYILEKCSPEETMAKEIEMFGKELVECYRK